MAPRLPQSRGMSNIWMKLTSKTTIRRMRPMRPFMLFCLLGCLVGSARGETPTKPTLAERVARVVPAADEQPWLKIPWRLDLLSAQVESYRTGKPIFMFLMDGHPLGNT